MAERSSYFPAIISAARIIGLGEYAVKALETEGIRLKEDETARSISWIGKVDKLVHQTIVAFSGTFGRHFLEIRALDNAGQVAAGIQLVGRKAAEGISSIAVEAINGRVIVLNSERASNFVQFFGDSFSPQVVKCCMGCIGATGAIISAVGAPFTVNHYATGTYRLTFAPEGFRTTPIVNVTDVQGTQRTGCYTVLTSNIIDIVMSNGTGAREDIAFSFFLIN